MHFSCRHYDEVIHHFYYPSITKLGVDYGGINCKMKNNLEYIEMKNANKILKVHTKYEILDVLGSVTIDIIFILFIYNQMPL